jgi:hypothetical protein
MIQCHENLLPTHRLKRGIGSNSDYGLAQALFPSQLENRGLYAPTDTVATYRAQPLREDDQKLDSAGTGRAKRPTARTEPTEYLTYAIPSLDSPNMDSRSWFRNIPSLKRVQTVSRLRPFRRRAASTLRPVGVVMRERKP